VNLANTAKMTCLLVLTIASQAFAGEKINALDRMMYTINPNAQISGPIFNDKADQEVKNNYASKVIDLILKTADAKAKKYKEAGDYRGYYAFLSLALTVPMHEGLYIQFRNINENVCRADVNSGERIRKSSEESFQIFTEYFKKGPDAFIPDCEELASETCSTQIIRGGDGSDLSMMQISLRWHADDFLANKKYENVEQSLDYGMSQLLSGFNQVYRNARQYKCLYEKSSVVGKKKFSYVNLIRGVWGGKYNSGTTSKTCRFADFKSAYKVNDAGFLGNLKKIINFNETISVDLVGKFTLNEIERDAIREISLNLKNNTNNRVALDKLLADQIVPVADMAKAIENEK
jgi:hypothetical protein